MRYVVAVLFALALGATAVVPAALAEGNAGHACYTDGVAHSCVAPAAPTLY
jgi:hypothetical protein